MSGKVKGLYCNPGRTIQVVFLKLNLISKQNKTWPCHGVAVSHNVQLRKGIRKGPRAIHVNKQV